MNQTQRDILSAGVEVLEQRGMFAVTARNINEHMGRPPSGHAYYYWPHTNALLEAVACEAIRVDNRKAVARLIADGHSIVADWGVAKRRRYLAMLA